MTRGRYPTPAAGVRTVTTVRDPFAGPFFDAATAATYVCSKSVNAFYRWRVRHGIKVRANGSILKADLDYALTFRATPRRGGSVRHPHSLANLRNAKTVTEP